MLGANVLCLKKKKKRTYSLSTCKGHEKGGGSRNERARGGTLTMMQITEDTPPDMLAGAMDLTVHLPNGKAVKMSIERSTPMMDLLVQITTANHLQLSNHTLQVLGMAPSSEYSDKTLPFKPNTPIGTLDTQHIRVLPKGRVVPQPKSVPPPGHQPFESTFRLKVHLPRNQLYVTRVSRNVLLEDIMRKVCEEKNLDPMKYDFKHPGNLDEVLDPKLTLSDYQITEIYVVSKGTTNLNQAFSTTDIMVLRKEEERKQMHNKTGGGVFNLIFKRGKSSMGSGSVSSNDNRSISPTHSDDSRSVTPPAPPLKKEPPLEKPKPPQRKRRPAPKPPQGSVNNEEENLVTNDTNEETRRPLENGLTICHSRNSSDSSGYHEASILSEHGANASLPRNRPKSMAFGSDLPPSQGTSNLTKMATHSRSTTSLIAGRKKKAAPPPPQIAVSPASSVIAHSEHPNPLVASQPEISHRSESIPTSNLSSQLAEVTPEPPKIQTQEEKSLESTDSGIAQDHKEDTGFRTPPPPPILDDIIVPDEIPKTNDLIDWEYQLPSPPKAFRDSSPQDTLLETNSLGGSTDFKDSVVTSPELFEKLRTLEDKESMISEEPPLNTLSLEHLEKRKSLVYNRELATSLKMTDSVESRPSVNSASMANFQKPAEKTARHHHDTLPNFKITTYDVPKHQNIKVFEDDTVRSNENVSYSKRNSEDLNSDISNTDYVFYKPQAVSRSGSFSTDAKTSTKPVSRSRSTLTLNKYHTTIKKELGDSSNISRSSSLFNVSGLHSLEVMKVIRNKLNTSTGSTENLQQTPQKPPPTLVVQREEPVAEEPPQQPDPAPVDSPKPAEPVKKYYYRGPPAVNMSTWSERPKVPVSVKEDEDYKLGNVNHNGNAAQKSEITQSSGNVVIKIGPATNSTRLMAPAAYRKPLGNLNGGSEPQRPHSIAFDSSFDINRVPVVRSVEFKKPYKDFHVNNSHLNNTHQINTHVNNTSIIHLNQEQSPLEEPQHNAFKVRSRTPIVRGFNSNRLSWHASSGGNFNSTLPLSKPKEDHYVPNQHVPFSQLTLRRTESSKRYMSDQNANNVVKPIVEPNNNNSNSSKPWSVSAPPPPPPQVPKKTISQKRSQSIKNNNNSEDVRDMLMESIRNFGGKKGLKTVKA
ncbi:muscle M-line assembly protein unc-89 isoform X5 [Euwallacea similis]|uniref:muscle M-line assembly protein unc-89 isoform X5 n=1 Tax=Euwallacea similis TaxID=1736056 RepID=UPI00344FE8C4